MLDREKAIRKLKEALENAENEGEIFAEVRRPVLFDAIAMLKDDETRIQYLKDHIAMCKEQVERLYKEQANASKRNPVIVCPHCGKRVK